MDSWRLRYRLSPVWFRRRPSPGTTPDAPESRLLFGRGMGVCALALSADGEWIAVADHQCVELWARRAGRRSDVVSEIRRTMRRELAVVGDEPWVVHDASDSAIRAFCHFDGEERILDGFDGIRGLARVDDRHVVAVSGDGSVRLWNPSDDSVRTLYLKLDGPIAVAADGRTAIAADGATVRCVDLETGDARDLGVHKGRITSVAIAPDGRTAASWSLVDVGGVKVWNLDPRRTLTFPERFSSALIYGGMTFTPDGSYLAYPARAQLGLIELATGRVFRGGVHPRNVESVVATGDLLLAGAGRQLRTWKPSKLAARRQEDDPVGDATIARDGRTVYLRRSATLELFDVAAGRTADVVPSPHAFGLHSFVVPDDRLALVASPVGREKQPSVQALDLGTHRVAGQFSGSLPARPTVLLAGDGERVYVRAGDRHLVYPLSGLNSLVHVEPRAPLAVRHDARQVVVRRKDPREVDLLELSQGATTTIVEDWFIDSAAYFPDGALLLGRNDGRVTIHNATGTRIAEASLGDDPIEQLVIARDGERVVAVTDRDVVVTTRSSIQDGLADFRAVLEADCLAKVCLDDTGRLLLTLDKAGNALLYDLVDDD